MPIKTWQSAVSADWTVAGDWSPSGSPITLDTAVISVAGVYDVSIAAAETITTATLLLSAGTLTVAGLLTLTAASTIAAGATLDGGGTFNINGKVSLSSTLVNQGVIAADGAANNLQFSNGVLTNQGTLLAANASSLYIFDPFFSNLSSGTLTGGSYAVLGAPSGTFAQIGFESVILHAVSTIAVDAANITLSGLTSRMLGWDGISAFIDLETSMTSIDPAGTLSLLAGRGWNSANPLTVSGHLNLAGGNFVAAGGLTLAATGNLVGSGIINPVITNAGTIEAKGGLLVLTSGVSDGGVLQTDPGATLLVTGTRTTPVVNNGFIRVDSGTGTLKLTGAINGGGGFILHGNASGPAEILELGAATSGGIIFNGGLGDLKLDNPNGFTGGVTGFQAGQTIDLAGIVASQATLVGNTLTLTNGGTPVYAIKLASGYAGASFSATPDGSGNGTNITVATVNYALEGPNWASRTITWSYATSNLAGDSAHPYSQFINTSTQSQFAAVVQQALARWSAVANLAFVQVADSPNADIRIGWGNLLGSGTGEIGEAAYNFSGSTFSPDTVVRLEDPALTALDASGAIGGFIYHGLSSTLYQVAVHEIGHALGLGHSTDSTSVMFPTAQGVINQDTNASDIAGINAIYAGVACYAEGTHILTETGECRVEHLRPGVRVPGLAGQPVRRIRWIGRRHLVPRRHPQPCDVQPIHIAAHAFGPSQPHRDLVLSPDHAVFVNNVLIPIRYLVNGRSVAQQDVPDVTYFHVELEDGAGAPVHGLLLAEGLPAESYLDTGNRHVFERSGPALALHPEFAMNVWSNRAVAPLHIAGEAVVSARRRLLPRRWAVGRERPVIPALEIVDPSMVR